MKNKHIAFIPARQGSVGLKQKNRLFFDNTANFLDKVDIFDEVLVSSDDCEVISSAKKRNYLTHNRKPALSGSSVSIKSVLKNVIVEMNIDPEIYIWLFYLPILYKDKADFISTMSKITRHKIESLCSFIPARSHPFNCWMHTNGIGLQQYIENDVFRRQDLPKAWMHHHYLCAFKAGCIDDLNSELINASTFPVFLDRGVADNLVEVDTPEDYKEWKRIIGDK